MKSAVAIRHVAFEDMGIFASVLAERGVALRYFEAGVDDLSMLDACAPDLMVILGGPIGANDEADYPFISDEICLLKQRLSADLPTLGICLGAQIMARALGTRVYPASEKEIGFHSIALTDAGHLSPLRHLDENKTAPLHWHGDTFDLPTGATLLASTAHCRQQAYSWGKGALAFQCHPEAQTLQLERWFIGHASEISAVGLSVSQLRKDAALYGPSLEKQGKQCFSDWLNEVGL